MLVQHLEYKQSENLATLPRINFGRVNLSGEVWPMYSLKSCIESGGILASKSSKSKALSKAAGSVAAPGTRHETQGKDSIEMIRNHIRKQVSQEQPNTSCYKL